jgi:hypothetical protein
MWAAGSALPPKLVVDIGLVRGVFKRFYSLGVGERGNVCVASQDLRSGPRRRPLGGKY